MSATAPLELGRFFQLGYVTNDLDQAMEYTNRTFGVQDYVDYGQFDSAVIGGIAKVRVAQGRLGEIVFELVQPCGGDDALYANYLPDPGFAVRLHHTAYYLDDPVEWRRLRQALDAQGKKIVIDGRSPSSEYIYVDFRDELGQYAEVVHRPGFDPSDPDAERRRVAAAIAAIGAAKEKPKS
jgi:hypothetical protein